MKKPTRQQFYDVGKVQTTPKKMLQYEVCHPVITTPGIKMPFVQTKDHKQRKNKQEHNT